MPSKKKTIFGHRLHPLSTLGGVILDAELAPASESDLEVGFEYTQLTAHILGVYINRLLGKAEFLRIKALAFPIARKGLLGPRSIQPSPTSIQPSSALSGVFLLQTRSRSDILETDVRTGRQQGREGNHV